MKFLAFVKEYVKEHPELTFKEAVKSEEVKCLYHKSGKAKYCKDECIEKVEKKTPKLKSNPRSIESPVLPPTVVPSVSKEKISSEILDELDKQMNEVEEEMKKEESEKTEDDSVMDEEKSVYFPDVYDDTEFIVGAEMVDGEGVKKKKKKVTPKSIQKSYTAPRSTPGPREYLPPRPDFRRGTNDREKEALLKIIDAMRLILN